MANSSTKQREILKSKSASLKQSLNDNMDELKSNSEDIGKAAIIGGGILLGGYLIYKLLKSDNTVQSDGNEKVVYVNAPRESTLAKSIKTSIITFLLAIAKQKLLEYLDSRNEEDGKE